MHKRLRKWIEAQMSDNESTRSKLITSCETRAGCTTVKNKLTIIIRCCFRRLQHLPNFPTSVSLHYSRHSRNFGLADRAYYR